MLVRSFERFAEVAAFDPVGGAVAGRRAASSEGEVFGARGFYVTLAGSDVVFYRAGAELRLWLHGRSRRADASTVTWQKSGRLAELSVVDPAGGRATVEYRPTGAIDDDPTPFVEDEHWDFGLFVVNVLNDEGRARSILGGAAADS